MVGAYDLILFGIIQVVLCYICYNKGRKEYLKAYKQGQYDALTQVNNLIKKNLEKK